MTGGNVLQPSRAIFSAILTPHRSLGPRGFVILMLVFGGVSFVWGLVFVSIGAWPIFGFFGIDVLLLYAAFRLSYRAGRRYEEVEVSPTEVLLRRVDAGGGIAELRFNPAFVRLGVERREGIGVAGLTLSSRGRTELVGAFLNPDDRASFAKALGAALSAARSGAAFQP